MSKTLTVLLLTYNRIDYAKLTLDALFKNLYHNGPIRLHIADDGSPDGYIQELESYARHICGFEGICSISNSNHGGYGKNYNLATQMIHEHTDWVLPLEDDWQLIRGLDTSSFVDALDLDTCIRLGYIGFTQELKSSFKQIGKYKYLAFDPDSLEPHVFAGHPRLETVEWERNVGPWPEELLPGATEMAVTHIYQARCNVLWPIDLVHPSGNLFVHIGTNRSY